MIAMKIKGNNGMELDVTEAVATGLIQAGHVEPVNPQEYLDIVGEGTGSEVLSKLDEAAAKERATGRRSAKTD